MTVAITALPTPPSSTDPVNFDARADAFLAALPSTVTQMNVQNTENNSINSQAAASATSAASSAAAATANGAAQVTLAANQVTLATAQVALATNQATTAAGHAATALTHATTSAVNAGAVLWVSGTTYAIGDARYSAVTGQTYRRLTVGAGTIDPSADATNWKPILLDVQTNLPTIRPSLNLDFANSKTVDPRIGFTRATTATYYDGKTTTKAEENLFRYSQDFDSAAWGKLGTTVSANTTTAPDSTTTADSIIVDSSTGRHIAYQQYNYVYSGEAYTASFHVKASGYNYVAVGFEDILNGVKSSFLCDLTNGSFKPLYSSGSLFSGTSCVVTDKGNGWYLVGVTTTVTVYLSLLNIQIGPSDSYTPALYVGMPSFTGNGTSGLYVWGAQLERRGFMTSYTPTTADTVTNYIPTLLTAVANQPRINHDPVTGECLGLLVEASATNLLTYSSELSAISTGASTRIANQLIAPDGSLTGVLIKGAGTAVTVITQSATATSTIMTFSCYVKVGIPSTRTTFSFLMRNATTGVDFTIGYFSTNTGSITGTDWTSTHVGNNWYRISYTNTATQLISVGDTLTVYFGAIGAAIYSVTDVLGLWGAQLEAQRMATSYIPTTSATVTRNSDTALISGNNFTSFYNQTEGTIFIEANYNKSSAEFLSNRIMYEVGTDSSNRFIGYNNNSSGAGFTVIESNNTYVTLGSVGVADNSFKKVAHSYKTNDFGASLNGSVAALDSSGKVPRSSILGIGSTIGGTAQLSGHIKKLTYYPVRLSNTTLQAMTAQ